MKARWFKADNHGQEGLHLTNFDKDELEKINKKERISPSLMAECYKETPGHAMEKKRRPQTTSATQFGTIFHTMAEGQDVFDEKYTVIPNAIQFGSNLGKEAACDFLAGYGIKENPKGFKKGSFEDHVIALGLNVVKQAWVDSMGYIWENLQKHVEIMEYLSQGYSELTLWHHDLEIDMGIKGIVDWLSEKNTTILDYKTTGKSINKKAFNKNVFNDNLDLRAYMYSYILELITGEVNAPFKWIPIEQTAPYSVALYSADALTMEIGKRKFEIARERWYMALKAGVFHTYQNDGVGEEVTPEYWMLKAMDIEV